MKAAANAKKSSTTSRTATQAANQPFFAKAGGGNFFAPVKRAVVPSVQTKMAVNKPGDKFEQEADKMAGKVMRMPEPQVRRLVEPESEDKEDTLQTKSADGSGKNESRLIPGLAPRDEPAQDSERISISEESVESQGSKEGDADTGEEVATPDEGETVADEDTETASEGETAGGGGVAPGSGDAVTALDTTTETDTGAGDLGTGDLVLIDVELAEHQRWAGALGRVGEVGSLERAEFVAEAVGSGFISGAASGLAMGLGMGLATRAVPAIGPVVGGAMALHGLVTRDWGETGATIGRFGEGNSTYETLANTIASVAAVIDVVSQGLTVINGIVGIVHIAALALTTGATIATVLTLGAAAPVAVAAGSVVAKCTAISAGINVVTMVLDTVNSAILQPSVTLFRALHTFTTEADPREVEAQGQGISTAAAASGAALGAYAGGKAAEAGGRPRAPAEVESPSQRPPHETPPPAPGDGPTVHFQEPATPGAHPEGAPPIAAHAEPVPAAALSETMPTGRRVTDDQSMAPSAPLEPQRLTSPDMEGHPGTVPAGIDTPPPSFVPEHPQLGQNWQYGERVPDRGTLGHNVQADHVIAQAKLRDIVTDPTTGQVHYPSSVRESLTVLTETGAATPDRPALPHTEVTFHDPQSDVAEIARLRAQGGPTSFTDDIVGPSRDARLRAGYDPQAVDRGWVDQLGRLHATQRMADTGGHIERLSGGPITSADIEGLNWSALGPAPSASATPEPQSQAILPAAASPHPPSAAPRPVSEGQTRSLQPLSPTDYAHYADMAVSMGMPREQIQSGSGNTAYIPGSFDTLLIGPDIHPLPASERPTGLANPANAALEPRAVLGHEIIGHREAELMGQVRDEPWHEELQASARAALHTPGLSREQSWLLLQDAAARRRFQTREGEIYINTERYGASEDAATGGRRPPEHFRPQDQQPKVIVNREALDSNQTEAPPRNVTSILSSTSPGIPSTFVASAGAARTAVAQQTPGGPQSGSESPSWGTRAHQVGELFLPQLFGPSGEAPTYEQQQAVHRARFTEDNQPAEGVERVNPEYPPPPATPAQITAIQNEILNLLAVRAAAEQEAETQAGRADHCEANQGPIQQTVEDTTAGILTVQAHDAAIARREAVNQEQQQRQQEAQGLTAGYPSRATGLAALTVPLAAWEGFTSLASHLPGEAGAKMLQMNREAQQMQDAFTQMGAEMLGVDNAGPARQAELQTDQGRLAATSEQAQTSNQELQTASAGAQGLQQANEAALAEASQRRDTATDRAQECSDAVAEREARADSLAEQLRVWAEAHKAARDQAIQATINRLQSEGKTIVGSSEQ